MIPGANCWETFESTHGIQSVGKQAIPHIAARNFFGEKEFRVCLSMLQEVGIKRALLIGGGGTESKGSYTCSMDLLTTGLFAEYGINALDFAGHPDGNPDDPDSEYHLLEKLSWTEARGISTRILKQWSLNTERTNKLKENHIHI